ncbi:MAG: aromatic amino acid ammonia-lyase, partial [Actinomycetota bacterium]|nr:aromatic amino acid ammonia-lyase [Actinomycetota bacterium]
MDSVVELDGYGLTLEAVVAVARAGAQVQLAGDPRVRERIEASRSLNDELLRTGAPVYGVTTGFGDSVNRQVGVDKAHRVPEFEIRKNGCGRGPYLPVDQARAVVVVRTNCLARGNSAVRPELIDSLIALLNRGITPCIREIGSVGASGDLIPGSYIAATLMGDRNVYYRGEIVAAADALRAEGIEPLVLGPKEGLAMTNGTQFMTGVGILATRDANRIAQVATICSAMAVEALGGVTGPFDAFLQRQKPHPGQVRTAAQLRALLQGSHLARDYRRVVEGLGTLDKGFRVLPVRIQDRYSLRCSPQFIGALYDCVSWVSQWLQVELNSSNDNPLYDVETGLVHSGGNFTGGHVGLAMDTLRVAVASVGDLVDRQLAQLVDDKFSNGLPAGLIHPLPEGHPDEGIYHGFKGMQLLMSALIAEALQQCTPMTTFSRSTAAHNQDKVSMGATSARITRDVVALVEEALAVHLITLCQAIDIRGADGLGRTRAAYDLVRTVTTYVDKDRELEEDIAAVLGLIRSGALTTSVADELAADDIVAAGEEIVMPVAGDR